MRRQNRIWIGTMVLGSALGCGVWALGQQERVRVEVTVPAVPNIGTVTRNQPSSEFAVPSHGVVYVGNRGAYHIMAGGSDGHAMYRDANNQFWASNLTYYGMSNGYWITSVNGVPDTFLAFQARPASSDAPFFKVLIHTPNTTGYAAWDEATRGNAQ